MEKKVSLKNEYVHVKRADSGTLTFGGDQGFFDRQIGKSKGAKKKSKYGCGIVAFGDLLLYLEHNHSKFGIPKEKKFQKMDFLEEEYVKYFDRIYFLLGGILFRGITCLRLMVQFNRLSFQYRWKKWAIWGWSRRKLFDRIERMIGRDLPVILCIPVLIPCKKQDGLWLYERMDNATYQRRALTRSHFITITGFIKNKEETWYEISSWGKKYYFNKAEYDKLLKSHFLANYFGNILYILN